MLHTATAEAIASTPLQHLTSLDFSSYFLDDEQDDPVSRLLDSPCITNLRKLCLGPIDGAEWFGDVALPPQRRDLCERALPQLTELNVGLLRGEGLAHLADADLPCLRKLVLEGAYETTEGSLATLSGALWMRSSVEVLDLSFCGLGECLRPLTVAPLGALMELCVKGCDLSGWALEAIAQAPWPRLAELNLSDNPRLFQDHAACLVFASAALPSLRRLDLDRSGITFFEGGTFWCMFAGARWLGQLERLKLREVGKIKWSVIGTHSPVLQWLHALRRIQLIG